MGAVQTISKTAHLTVLETVPPVFGICPEVSVFTTNPAGAVVNFATPSATDNSPTPPIVTCLPASGSQFPLGTTAVTCTARDGSGNTATCTFNVVVGFHSIHDSTIGFLPNGSISLVFRGTTGQTYKIQRSTNLTTDWVDLTTVMAGPDGTIPAQDPSPPPQRAFYRAKP